MSPVCGAISREGDKLSRGGGRVNLFLGGGDSFAVLPVICPPDLRSLRNRVVCAGDFSVVEQ